MSKLLRRFDQNMPTYPGVIVGKEELSEDTPQKKKNRQIIKFTNAKLLTFLPI